MSELESTGCVVLSDLTDDEWEIVRTLLIARPQVVCARGDHGRWKKLNRNAINGILWRMRTGCEWRTVPERYGKWNSVYRYYRRLVESGAWRRVHDALSCRPHSMVRAGMNCDEAIALHRRWTYRLSQSIRSPDRSLKCEVVGRDDRCILGEWIYSGWGRLAKLPEFQSMKDAHARFHMAAGDIVRRLDRGENIVAESVFGADSPYMKASQEVIGALELLKRSLA